MSELTTLTCPLCESYQLDDYRIIGYGSQAEGGIRDFPVLRCRLHGIEFADARPLASPDPDPKGSLDRLYGTDTKSQLRYIDFMDRIEAIVGSAGGRLLHDVGCGNGQLVFEARRRGWRVQGSDIIPAVKAELEANGVRCLIGTLSDLPADPNSCDVVTSFCVLPHHLTDSRADMNSCWMMLRPGGWLILQIPDNGLYRRFGKFLYHALLPWRPLKFSRFLLANLYGPGGHQFAFTRKNLAHYLYRYGFKQVIFRSYYPSARYALARFRSKALWFRVAAAIALGLLKLTGRAFGLPNHCIAYARKPNGDRTNLGMR